MASVRSKKESMEKTSDKRIYCGPNLPGLNQFTVIEGQNNILKLHIESCPAISKLIVPIENLNYTRLDRKSTRLNSVTIRSRMPSSA